MNNSNPSNKKQRHSLIVGLSNTFEPKDKRLMKPVCYQVVENNIITGSMVTQELDSVTISSNRKATYFLPNNIALLLSISEKALQNAKKLHDECLINPNFELDMKKTPEGDRQQKMDEVATLVCDYLEHIQTAIVFGYTALEAFTNLSIPPSYKYVVQKNSKGVKETYDKTAIERNLSLKVKIKHILVEIYKTPKIENQKWWSALDNLETYRHDIIHQKSIDSTEFYKTYFKASIFKICKTPVKTIEFFHYKQAENNRTNPIWPWLDDLKCLPTALVPPGVFTEVREDE